MTHSCYIDRAVSLALEAESEGNLPVGALLVLDDAIIGEGKSELLVPCYNPGNHAEIGAIRSTATELWHRASEMTCYTTLEPCVMCFGTLLLHGVGRVVFGANDTLGGAGTLIEHLPPYYEQASVFEWVGPVDSERCDPLYERADEIFAALPIGRGS